MEFSLIRRRNCKSFLKRREEAKRRDHRRLGRELDLSSLHEEGPIFPFFTPRGMVVINALLDLWRREHLKRGYQEVKTPMILERASLGTIRPFGNTTGIICILLKSVDRILL